MRRTRFYQTVFNNARDHIDVDIAAADDRRSFIGVGNAAVQHSARLIAPAPSLIILARLHH